MFIIKQIKALFAAIKALFSSSFYKVDYENWPDGVPARKKDFFSHAGGFTIRPQHFQRPIRRGKIKRDVIVKAKTSYGAPLPMTKKKLF